MLLMDDKLDALTEVVNIGVGRAAASLSELIGERIELHVPELKVLSLSEADGLYSGGVSVVQGFHGEVSGNAFLRFPVDSGRLLASLLAGGASPEELPSYELSGILSEVGNILLNGVLGSISNVIDSDLEYEVPQFQVDASLGYSMRSDQDGDLEERQVLMADTSLVIQSQQIGGNVLIAFEVGSIEALLKSLGL